ncbi:MAG: hypothetical protein HY308_15795 [Gammaproteobacteria bacterium]|nr:hypothetical protein [Gammaproteobacteria bacterium]
MSRFNNISKPRRVLKWTIALICAAVVALMLAPERADENMALGPQVLQRAQHDIYDLTIKAEIARLHFDRAKDWMGRETIEDWQLEWSCVGIFSATRRKELDEFIETTRATAATTAEVEKRAVNRMRWQHTQFDRALEEWQNFRADRKKYEPMPRGSSVSRDRELGTIVMEQIEYQVNEEFTDNHGRELQDSYAEIIADLVSIHDKLTREQPYVSFAEKCQQWLEHKRRAYGQASTPSDKFFPMTTARTDPLALRERAGVRENIGDRSHAVPHPFPSPGGRGVYARWHAEKLI